MSRWKLPETSSFQWINLKQPIPFIPTPQDVLETMLEMAQPKPHEWLYDLGCGDGRIPGTAARIYGCMGVRFENNLSLVAYAQRKAAFETLREGRVKIVYGNLFTADLRRANVVTLYLTPEALKILKPRLERSLPRGARVVSHNYRIKGWKPTAFEEVLSRSDGKTHRVYLYNLH